MPEDKHCPMLRPSSSSDEKMKKKKKMKKRRKKVSTTPPESTEKPQAASETPPRLSSCRTGVQQPELGRKHPQCSGSPAQGDVDRLSSQASESLRWEGVLEDPRAEEKRLEAYRANRRQRYVTQHALGHTGSKEGDQQKASDQSNRGKD